MKTIKGPALFIAQFMGDEAPFNSLQSISRWASSLGYLGLQIPSNDERCFNVALAAESDTYCDEVLGTLAENGLALTELSTHIYGQLVAVHPAYDVLMDSLVPEHVRGNPDARRQWAEENMRLCAKASRRLGLDNSASFSGSLLWPTVYPWPQRPAGLVEDGFAELARRWRPILDAYDEQGVDVSFEIHPSEDLHDGVTFERFLEAVGGHSRANILFDPSHLLLQQIDYIAFLEIYAERIKAVHVKDAEFNPDGRSGLYGGYQDWIDRPGRFRSVGDGQVDFKRIFSQLARADFPGWAVVEWECALKDAEVGARESAKLVKDLIIEVTKHSFDDFAGGGGHDRVRNKAILGID
jgi:sugar phosphate isomerase/epimerase